MGKAKDRFKTPTLRTNNPAPNAYKPLNNFNEEHVFKKNAQNVIGKQKLDILDIHFNKREYS